MFNRVIPSRADGEESPAIRSGFLAALGMTLGLAAPLFAASQGGSIPLNLPLFPANNWWNTDISNAPLETNASTYLNFIGLTKGCHPDFGGDAGDGYTYGFSFIKVDGAQTKLTVDFTAYGDQSDGVDHDNGDTPFPFYPVPSEAITTYAWVEGGPPGNVDIRDDYDRHVLIVDTTNNTLYELYNVYYNGANWEAQSGAFFDMKTNNRRPDTWTSADAAGLAILPGLVRYDEVSGADEIRHAFRMTVRSTNGYVFPASHEAGSTTNAPPMGMRLRLKAEKNISGYSAEVQKIFRAMKKYGLIVADNGSDMYISGTYDTNWNNDVLNPAFSALKVSDFDVIQLGWKPNYSFVLSLANPAGSGDATSLTVTVYDANYNLATGYTGTIQFASSDGSATLPGLYHFTGADAGVHTFSVTLRTLGIQSVTAADLADQTVTGTGVTIVGPATPINFTATASSTTQVGLSWSSVSGATQYSISRASAGSPFATIGTTASTTYNDTTVSAGAAYVYKVKAIDSSARSSPYSVPDVATTVLFTDDPVLANTTAVKGVHITELRTAVNALRAAASLGSSTFTDATLNSSVPVKTLHVTELRTALTAARTALGLSTTTFTDTTLTAQTTKVKAAHVQELRTAVK